jgi:regulator of protease activity HflC (stomatin/prohibitin superfamily)
MDILHLVDRLEELFNKSRPLPFTHNVIVDEDRMLDIIDQMRISIPEEVKKAQQVFAQKDRLLAQAQEEAGRKLSIAQERADQLVEKDLVVADAQKRANIIIEQARIEAENIRAGADQYAMDKLIEMERSVQVLLNQIHNGMRVLDEKKSSNSERNSTDN